ncbi:MAG: hypothetical protein FWC29_05420 [Methanomassiliicoccaceae archaeon]|nr:hypothetical protein [Methanomassiliicoccaceae archaeon]
MEKIVSFLRKNVNGKTLYTDEKIYRLDDGRLEGTYSDQISFSNMFFSKVRFTLDMFVVSKEKIVEINTGNEVQNVYSSSLFKYSLAKRQSTGDVTGTMMFVSSSLMSGSIPAESTVSGIYDMKLENNTLSWIDDQMLYRDQPTAAGTFRPVSFREKCRFYIDESGLIYERNIECFNVDPKTMKRTPSKAEYPLFVSREREV